jgi:phosphatidylglycerol:prolipoprotein diacylglycerol transferase
LEAVSFILKGFFMYPYKLFLGLTGYDLFICAGVILCFWSFGYLADKRKLKAKLQNYALMCGVAAIGLGFLSAVLFQALYNIASRGKFEITANTGMTFYGGLIGGVAVFLIAWFGIGSFLFKDGQNKRSFFTLASCAVPSILVAHSLGRLGCLMAGCCHGARTDAWYGLMMHGNEGYARYVPVQLFEAVFLMALFGLLFIRAKEGKRYNLPIYMCAYAAWRFCIEFARDDYRGSIPWLNVTPSQFIAILMVLGSVGVFFLERYVCDRAEKSDSEAVADKNEEINETEGDGGEKADQ